MFTQRGDSLNFEPALGSRAKGLKGL